MKIVCMLAQRTECDCGGYASISPLRHTSSEILFTQKNNIRIHLVRHSRRIQRYDGHDEHDERKKM